MEEQKRFNLINNFFSTSSETTYQKESNTAIVHVPRLDASTVELLQWLNEQSVATEYQVKGSEQDDFSQLKPNGAITVSLDTSFLRTKVYYSFYPTVDEFLRLNRTKLNVEAFYIQELQLSYKAPDKDSFFQYYDAICMLQNIIGNIAAGAPEEMPVSDVKYTIFDRRKLTISSKYFYSDLQAVKKLENFFSLISELYDETMKESDKRTNILFLINALETVFVDQKEEIDFSQVLAKLQEIYEEYQVHHRAYINSLEPGKLKENFEKDIQEYLGKLNNLLSDVNSKMIFLPIAFIVSLGQLSAAGQAKNLVILMGMFIFCLLVHKFSRTQQELLYAIKYDIDDKKSTFEKNVSKFFKELEPKTIRLMNLVSAIDKRFQWTILLTWVIFVVVVLAVLYYWGIAEYVNHLFSFDANDMNNSLAHDPNTQND